jgi:hypothetical protein
MFFAQILMTLRITGKANRAICRSRGGRDEDPGARQFPRWAAPVRIRAVEACRPHPGTEDPFPLPWYCQRPIFPAQACRHDTAGSIRHLQSGRSRTSAPPRTATISPYPVKTSGVILTQLTLKSNHSDPVKTLFDLVRAKISRGWSTRRADSPEFVSLPVQAAGFFAASLPALFSIFPEGSHRLG